MGTDARVRTDEEFRELVDALLGASRTLVTVALRSLQACEGDITLAQYRALVTLCSRGPQRVAELAEATAVTPPNATRICARLSRKGLVRRTRSSRDRRSVRVSATEQGREVVAQVSAARRAELGRFVERMPVEGRGPSVRALKAFALATGTVPDVDRAESWGLDPVEMAR